MTQPIDVAYVEIVADTKDFRRTLSKELTAELRKIEKEAQSVGGNIEKAFKDAAEASNGLFRDSSGRLRDAKGRFAAAGEAAGTVLTEGLQSAAGAARTLNGTIQGVFQGLAQMASQGPAGLVLMAVQFAALGAAAATAAVAVQSFGIIAGAALAALPGLIGAAIAGFGVLAAALHGVGDAFAEQSKNAKSAGGAAVNNSRQIADAQRAVLQAEKDLVKAREDELERIEDINIALNRARVTEARAIDDVKNAQLELEDARKLGSSRAITEAELRLQEANATLVEAKDKTGDLAKEKAKADKNGVEGSEQVLRAQENLRDAIDRLAASQQKLGGAAAASNEAFNSLSKSAQDFVSALLAAKTELAPLQKAIQEAFFAGSAPLIDPIVENLKSLEPELTGLSSAFGGIFQEILEFLGSEEAKTALSQILTGLSNFLTAVQPAIGPLLEAFAGLAGQSGEFGDELGGAVAEGLLAIADFVKDVDLKQLFKDAKVEMDKWLPVIKDLASIAFSLFQIFLKIGEIIFPMIVTEINRIDAQLEMFKDVFLLVATAVDDFFKFLATKIGEAIGAVGRAITDLPKTISNMADEMLEAGKTLIKSLFSGLSAAGNFVTDFGKGFGNAIIDVINNHVVRRINDGMRMIEEAVSSVPLWPDVNFPTLPYIPKLAKGGLTDSPTFAQISETNQQEAVLPLENPRAMRAVGGAIADAGGTSTMDGGESFTVIVNLGDDQIIARQVKVVRKNNQRTARKIQQKPRMV